MKISKTIRRIAAFAMALLIAGMQTGYAAQITEQRKHVRVLILPKFEVGAMTGGFSRRSAGFL